MAERVPLISVTAKPSDTNPYGGASRHSGGKAILVAADAIKFPGAMAVGDELSIYVELLMQGRTSLKLKAGAIGRQRDSDKETLVAEGEFTFVALDENGKPREIAAKEASNG